MALGVGIAGLDRQGEAENDRFGRLEVVGVAFEPEQRADAGAQFPGVERLAEEIVGPGGNTLDAVLARVHARDHDHRDEARERVLFQAPAHLESVDVGEADVEQDEIRRLAVDGFERRQPGARSAHHVPLGLEHLGDEGQVRLLIVNGEYVAAYWPGLVHRSRASLRSCVRSGPRRRVSFGWTKALPVPDVASDQFGG